MVIASCILIQTTHVRTKKNHCILPKKQGTRDPRNGLLQLILDIKMSVNLVQFTSKY